jgi:hypothetical protein
MPLQAVAIACYWNQFSSGRNRLKVLNVCNLHSFFLIPSILVLRIDTEEVDWFESIRAYYSQQQLIRMMNTPTVVGVHELPP